MKIFLSVLKLLRPEHWIKNVLIFVPIIFAREFFIREKVVLTVITFLIFSAAASSVYIINDIADREQDRQHPKKKNRPIAAGAISVTQAIVILGVLLIVSALSIFYYVPAIALPIALYFIGNLAYSFILKHRVIFDILLVSGFYLLRIVVGGVATHTYISRWLVLCVLFSTLLIIIGKRRSELAQAQPRPVLKLYPPQLLDHLLTISAALTLLSYGIYSVLGVKSEYMVYSIFFVLLGVFRYLYIIYMGSDGEYPEKVLFTDRVMAGSILGWFVFVFCIFYLT